MVNNIKYMDKQAVAIPYKHNFIIHLILLIFAVILFIFNREVMYLNLCLCLYSLCLFVYLIYALIQTKIPKRDTRNCYTSWDFSSKEQFSICFAYDEVIDFHIFSLCSIKHVYWCTDYNAFLIIYKAKGKLSGLVPFVVHSPYVHSIELLNTLRSGYGLKTTTINYDQMVSLLTEYPK